MRTKTVRVAGYPDADPDLMRRLAEAAAPNLRATLSDAPPTFGPVTHTVCDTGVGWWTFTVETP